jgi:hypothetical protein
MKPSVKPSVKGLKQEVLSKAGIVGDFFWFV